MIRLTRIVLILLFPVSVFSQDVASGANVIGVWKGKIITTDKHLPYEIAISEKNGKLVGYSYTTYTVNSVEMVAVRTLKIKNDNGTVTTEDDDLLFDSFDKSSPKHIKQTNVLKLQSNADVSSLTGVFTTKKTRNFRALNGEIDLRKENDIKQSQIATKLEEMKLLSDLSFTPKEEIFIMLDKKTIEPGRLTASRSGKPLTIAKPLVKKVILPAFVPTPAIVAAKPEIKPKPVVAPASTTASIPVVKTTPKPVAPKPVAKAAVKTQALPTAPVTKVATTSISPSFSAALAKKGN